MEKSELCPHVEKCSFYQGKISDKNRPRFFILNVFCRGGHRGWTGCKRYQIYDSGETPPETMLPRAEATENEVLIQQKESGKD